MSAPRNSEKTALASLNALPEAQAFTLFEGCCTASRWCRELVARRPYQTLAALQQTADAVWATMQEDDILEAFAGHPKIGDVSSLREKYARTAGMAGSEQGAVSAASDEVLTALRDGNLQYEQQNGFIFIVCATGKSAEEMLALLQDRLQNDRDTELRNGAEEQRKITAIRIAKTFTE